MPQRSQPISEEEAVATRASVSKLIKHVLTARNTGVFEKHIRDVLDTLLWKYTEASGKYSTRYYSAASAGQPEPLLCHEHVFQKRKMIHFFLSAATEAEIDQILSEACGCVVTREEHNLLKPYDDEYGWIRYSKAKIAVMDRETGKVIAHCQPARLPTAVARCPMKTRRRERRVR